ncbi:amidohydrolase family protein [Dickeya chrysanthemi]|uniref:amidohydrolase family protein n=1 Tax=Dickeya chrysanthemi TaxID=556 RepID=UPI003340FA06
MANDATALDAATTLRAATLGGARALGFGDKIGSPEIGKQADLVCVDLSALETQPLHHVLSQLIYSAASNCAEYTSPRPCTRSSTSRGSSPITASAPRICDRCSKRSSSHSTVGPECSPSNATAAPRWRARVSCQRSRHSGRSCAASSRWIYPIVCRHLKRRVAAFVSSSLRWIRWRGRSESFTRAAHGV